MSKIPYYRRKRKKNDIRCDGQIIDGLVYDGLTDVYNETYMGVCGDSYGAEEMNITKEEQDNFAIESYKKVKCMGRMDYLIMNVSWYRNSTKKR